MTREQIVAALKELVNAELRLGRMHWLNFTTDYDGNERTGAIVDHLLSSGDICGGYITFGTGDKHWTVNSWEPLDLHPSLLCHCGDHGHVRNGRWVAC
jgi:hypothetical protein